MIPTFIRSFAAAADVAGHTIATFADAANDTTVTEAVSNTAPLIGVFDSLGGKTGDMVDVHLAGMVEVKLGGAVSAGDAITADANGHGVTATAGADRHIVGFAVSPGASGDIIDVWMSQSRQL